MPHLLTTNARITCPHGGVGTSIPSIPKWSIDGGFVLVEGDTGTLSCPFAPHPCVGYQLRSMGFNATRIDGRRAILATDFQQSLTGLPLAIQEFHTTFDRSTPAPIPPGQAPPPLPPELADTTQPGVTAAPAELAFNLIALQPALVTVTFTLLSDYPSAWVLTLINPVQQTNLDLTAGAPPGLVVQPAGGAWDTPGLTVTLTMNAPFMAALGATGADPHSFFMTGISRRGLSDFTEVRLHVT